MLNYFVTGLLKICAEYMLPRPSLVCRPQPRCTWQILPGPGQHVPVFCTDLNGFYVIYFPFFITMWVWLGTLQDCRHAQCLLSLSIVIRTRLVIRQVNPPACLVEVQLENTLWHLCHRTRDIYRENGWNLYQWVVVSTRTKGMEIVSYLWVVLMYFSSESRLISGVVEIGQIRLFWSRIWQLSHSCQTGVREYFPSS